MDIQFVKISVYLEKGRVEILLRGKEIVFTLDIDILEESLMLKTKGEEILTRLEFRIPLLSRKNSVLLNSD